MGYNTEFKGELKFSRELTASQLTKIKQFLGEDCREHPEWGNVDGLDYINLRFLDDFSGLEWDGTEKTNDMVGCINLIIDNTQEEDFRIRGKLLAQGEDIDDRYEIVFYDGVAIDVGVEELKPTRSNICCPHCDKFFNI